jgi:hypothetical protein
VNASSATTIAFLCAVSALIVGQVGLALAFGVSVLIALCWRSEERQRELDREMHREEMRKKAFAQFIRGERS